LKLFVDSWAWIAISNQREPRHQEIKTLYEDLRLKKGILYTTDYILSETLTSLFKNLPFKTAKEGLEKIEKGISENYLILEWITKERFKKARDLRLKFQDKPRISFTDLTSMVVMKGLGIKDVLTEDDHFTQVGMGFRKVP
jgi:Predicted nucleic acid-binding protein, contains PIN domain